MAESLIQAMKELYETMAHMCGDQYLELQFAPEGGHALPPDLTADLERRKTPAAIDLIRRMPYVVERRQILPASEAINYTRLSTMGPRGQSRAWRPIKYGNTEMEERASSDPLGESIVKPCEVPITTYDDEIGSVFVVDTETWTARLWDFTDVFNGGDCTVHLGGRDACPPMCIHRTSRLPEQRPAVEFFREWRQEYLDLKWVLNYQNWEVITADDDDEDWFMITQQIFRDHGWPNDYRAEECQEALQTAPGPDDDLNVYSDTDEEGEDDGHDEL